VNAAMHGRCGGFNMDVAVALLGAQEGTTATTPNRTTTITTIIIVVLQTTMVSVLFARSARRKNTQWYSFGTVLMRAMELKGGLLLLPLIPMEWIQTSTPTRVPQITSLASSRS
jgi:hypothetical protein